MLKQRVITASIMMLLFLALLFFSPPLVFVGFVGAIFLVGAWEWSNLCGLTSLAARILYTVLVAAMALLIFQTTSLASSSTLLKPFLMAACLWWLVAFFWVRYFPVGEKIARQRFTRMLLGVVVLVPAWLSVAYLRQAEQGALTVLLCLLIVAAVDVGAYFSGRRFGKRKLAPVVSPGKSWEGVWGGLAFAGLVGATYVAAFGQLNDFSVIAVILPAALISVVGDLFESMIKRVRGVKDSSTLLPGHGGFLDRIDGLVSAIPVFTLASLMTGWHL